MKRLAVVCTHPIQYNVPWFRLLANQERLSVRTFYTWHANGQGAYDPDFDRKIAWDIPLLEGYDWELVAPRKSISRKCFWNINRNITDAISSWSADAVLVLGWNYYSHVHCMRYFSGKIPVYFRGDSTLLDSHTGYRSTLRHMLLTHIYKYVDTAFFVGKNNYDYFREFGMRPEQLCFAPHAVDNAQFSSNGTSYEKMAAEWRSKLGISDKNVVFLYAGKLIPKKSPDLLLAAFKKFSDTHAADLVFVGQGAWESKLKEQANGMTNIHFLPFQNQSKMPVVYRLGDVVCLPSAGPGETWGLAVNEAMASGRPVIVSDKVGCARDLVANQETGYVHKAQSQLSLLNVMQKCQDRDELGTKGKSCLQFIKPWSCEALAKQITNRLLAAA